jgi:hypothetical protein
MEMAVVFRTSMSDLHREHPSEEALERFLLHQSTEEELELVETHILACEDCVSQLEELQLQINATKIALQNLEATSYPIGAGKPSWNWKSWLSAPRLSLAGGLAAVAGGAFFLSIPREVTLTAYRGLETPIVSEWRPLQVHLNAADLKEGPVVVELVDHTGNPLWKGSSVVRHDTVDVTLPPIKQSGSHFLRIYAAANGASEGELLREYAFQVKWSY